MRKPAFFICENKGEDQLCDNRAADQRLCFRDIDSRCTHCSSWIRNSSLLSTTSVGVGLRRTSSETRKTAAHFNLEMYYAENGDSRCVAMAIKRSKRLPPNEYVHVYRVGVYPIFLKIIHARK